MPVGGIYLIVNEATKGVVRLAEGGRESTKDRSVEIKSLGMNAVRAKVVRKKEEERRGYAQRKDIKKGSFACASRA